MGRQISLAQVVSCNDHKHKQTADFWHNIKVHREGKGSEETLNGLLVFLSLSWLCDPVESRPSCDGGRRCESVLQMGRLSP